MTLFLLITGFFLVLLGLGESLRKFFQLKIGEYREKDFIEEIWRSHLIFLSKNFLFSFFTFILLVSFLYFSLKLNGIDNKIPYSITAYFSLGFFLSLFILALILLFPLLFLKINYPFSRMSNNDAVFFVIKNSLYLASLLILFILLIIYFVFYLTGGLDIDYFVEASQRISFLWVGAMSSIFILFVAIKYASADDSIKEEMGKNFISLLKAFFPKSAIYILSYLLLSSFFICFSHFISYLEKARFYVFIMPILFIISVIAVFIFFEKYKKASNLIRIFEISFAVYVFGSVFVVWHFFNKNMWFLGIFLCGVMCYGLILYIENFAKGKFAQYSKKKYTENFFEIAGNFSLLTLIYILVFLIALGFSYYLGLKALSPFYDLSVSGAIGVIVFAISFISVSFCSFFSIFLENSISEINMLNDFSLSKSQTFNLNSGQISKDLTFNSYPYLLLCGLSSIVSAFCYYKSVFTQELPVDYPKHILAIFLSVIFLVSLISLVFYLSDCNFKQKFKLALFPDRYFSAFLFLFLFFSLFLVFFVVVKWILNLTFYSLFTLFVSFSILSSILIIYLENFYNSKYMHDRIDYKAYLEDFKDLFLYSSLSFLSFFIIILLF